MSSKTVNNELKTITIEELRQFNGFSNLSDTEALIIISTIKELSLVTHNIITNYEQPTTVSKLRKA